MTIKEAAYQHESAFLKTLTDIVLIETPTSDKVACDKLADYFEENLSSAGWQVERIAKEQVGDQLIARQKGGDGKSNLILTHYDTVWSSRKIETMSYKREGNIFFGSGIFDILGMLPRLEHFSSPNSSFIRKKQHIAFGLLCYQTVIQTIHNNLFRFRD